MQTIRRLGFIVLWMFALGLGPTAQAADYPTKPIKIVVPVAPGGITDILARYVGEKLQERLGQSVVVDNRSGAGGQIGNEATARSPADGYTLLMSSSSLSAAPYVSKAAKLDPLKDFTHIIEVGRTPFLLVTNAKVPAKDLREFIAYAKAHPGQMNYGSLGISTELDFEVFKRRAGIYVTPIRYRGTSPVLMALLNDEIQTTMTSYRAVKEHIDSGKLRALGVAAAQRLSLMPSLPTLSEAGLSGYTASAIWIGVSAPAGTPADIVAKLNAQIDAIVKLPETRERLASMGYVPSGGSSERFTQVIRDDVAYFGEAQRITGMQPE